MLIPAPVISATLDIALLVLEKNRTLKTTSDTSSRRPIKNLDLTVPSFAPAYSTRGNISEALILENAEVTGS